MIGLDVGLESRNLGGLDMCREEMRNYVGKRNENGASRKEKERKTKEKVHGYGEDSRVIGAVEEDAFDRMRWGRMIRCSDP